MISQEQIEKLASGKNVKAIAVHNFLGSAFYGNASASECYSNLEQDARLYSWNAATQKAIRKGIASYFKK